MNDELTWKVVAGGLWAIVTALFSWFALGFRDEQKAQSARIDSANARLDDTVSKEDFKDTLATFRAERDAQHKDNREERVRLHDETLKKFNELSRKIDTQAVQDQRILQCERDIITISKYAEDIKHVNVDPYVRLTAVLEQRIKAVEERLAGDNR